MGLTGDFAGLADLASRLESLPSVLSDISRESADEAVMALRKGFNTKTDPYGAGWAPQKRSYGNPLMRRSGALVRSVVSSKVTARGFSVTYGTKYGSYHQGGTRRMLRRMLIPTKWIPPKWEEFITRIASEKLSAHLG